jgi:hypothetical protein
MADDQNCFRCGKRYELNQLTASKAGNRYCQECWARVDPANEVRRPCPVDGVDMKKRLVADAVVIDTCATCGGLWFDKGELDVIERKSRDMGWQQGFFTSILLL